jgi:hypothetical protein
LFPRHFQHPVHRFRIGCFPFSAGQQPIELTAINSFCSNQFYRL